MERAGEAEEGGAADDAAPSLAGQRGAGEPDGVEAEEDQPEQVVWDLWMLAGPLAAAILDILDETLGFMLPPPPVFFIFNANFGRG